MKSIVSHTRFNRRQVYRDNHLVDEETAKRHKINPERINYSKSEVHERIHDQGAQGNARWEVHRYREFFKCECIDVHTRSDCLYVRRKWYKKNPRRYIKYKPNYMIYYWII
jgi:hypothetical protein